MASHVIVLKAVLQSVPIYQLSGQVVHKMVCYGMFDIFKSFMWQGKKMEKKWALLSWCWLSKPLKAGGLGLRDPYTLNQVMGAKLWRRSVQGGTNLWKEI